MRVILLRRKSYRQIERLGSRSCITAPSMATWWWLACTGWLGITCTWLAWSSRAQLCLCGPPHICEVSVQSADGRPLIYMCNTFDPSVNPNWFMFRLCCICAIGILCVFLLICLLWQLLSCTHVDYWPYIHVMKLRSGSLTSYNSLEMTENMSQEQFALRLVEACKSPDIQQMQNMWWHPFKMSWQKTRKSAS